MCVRACTGRRRVRPDGRTPEATRRSGRTDGGGAGADEGGQLPRAAPSRPCRCGSAAGEPEYVGYPRRLRCPDRPGAPVGAARPPSAVSAADTGKAARRPRQRPRTPPGREQSPSEPRSPPPPCVWWGRSENRVLGALCASAAHPSVTPGGRPPACPRRMPGGGRSSNPFTGALWRVSRPGPLWRMGAARKSRQRASVHGQGASDAPCGLVVAMMPATGSPHLQSGLACASGPRPPGRGRLGFIDFYCALAEPLGSSRQWVAGRFRRASLRAIHPSQPQILQGRGAERGKPEEVPHRPPLGRQEHRRRQPPHGRQEAGVHGLDARVRPRDVPIRALVPAGVRPSGCAVDAGPVALLQGTLAQKAFGCPALAVRGGIPPSAPSPSLTRHGGVPGEPHGVLPPELAPAASGMAAGVAAREARLFTE